METTRTRYAWFALAVMVGAVLIAAAPTIVRRQNVARAEQIRARCVREFSAKSAWRAEIVETERGSDGARSVMLQELLVRKPGEYRLTLRERDTSNREVVSTTIRTSDAFYTHRRNADGSTELHVIRGARPSLGVELDNLLGQTVQAVSEATPLKVVGRGSRYDRPADKLELGPGRFVWVDQATGLPLEEQVVSEGKVAHSVRITAFDDQASAPDDEFDPASLGAADTTTVEDLGFRPGVSAQAAAREIGFMPLDVPVPEGFSADVRGYVDPRVPNGDAPAEAAYVCLFSKCPAGVIVTQVARPGMGDSFVPADTDEGSSKRVEVDGRPAEFFDDAVRPRLVFADRDVLVTIEGNLTESELMEFAEQIR
jgi:outer membrane lipoprotein-sorting protein